MIWVCVRSICGFWILRSGRGLVLTVVFAVCVSVWFDSGFGCVIAGFCLRCICW